MASTIQIKFRLLAQQLGPMVSNTMRLLCLASLAATAVTTGNADTHARTRATASVSTTGNTTDQQWLAWLEAPPPAALAEGHTLTARAASLVSSLPATISSLGEVDVVVS